MRALSIPRGKILPSFGLKCSVEASCVFRERLATSLPSVFLLPTYWLQNPSDQGFTSSQKPASRPIIWKCTNHIWASLPCVICGLLGQSRRSRLFVEALRWMQHHTYHQSAGTRIGIDRHVTNEQFLLYQGRYSVCQKPCRVSLLRRMLKAAFCYCKEYIHRQRGWIQRKPRCFTARVLRCALNVSPAFFKLRETYQYSVYLLEESKIQLTKSVTICLKKARFKTGIGHASDTRHFSTGSQCHYRQFLIWV